MTHTHRMALVNVVAVFFGMTVVAPVVAHAEISFVDMFRSNSFVQTGNGNTLSTNGSFLSLSLTSVGANDYSAVQTTYPGPASPVVLAPNSPTVFQFQTPAYPTQAAMDADFPHGNYSYQATKTGGSDTTGFTYSADAYPLTLPYLTGTNFGDLQGMNPAAAFSLQFSPFTPSPAASESFLFLTVFDTVANAFVFNSSFQPTTTAGLTLPANTLLPKRAYLYELIFSDRVLTPATGSDFDAQLGFDVRTTGSFTTGVPEPAALLLGLVACGSVSCFWPRAFGQSRGCRT
jgi:hypothetical protein